LKGSFTDLQKGWFMPELTAQTLQVEPNSTYLNKTQGLPTIQDPMSGSTVGFLMIISAFQYASPIDTPVYTQAFSQAGKAAYIQSGGQDFQNKLQSKAEAKAKQAVSNIGLQEVVRDRQVQFNGPSILSVKTHATLAPDQATVGLKLEF
jgi:hypothetical protein